eukprot:10955410-Lingulodinium_polyedra.AAC.1
MQWRWQVRWQQPWSAGIASGPRPVRARAVSARAMRAAAGTCGRSRGPSFRLGSCEDGPGGHQQPS